jgi:hypothetical protein
MGGLNEIEIASGRRCKAEQVMFSPVEESPKSRLCKAALAGSLAAVAVLVAACGGGARQDTDEASGTYKLDIISASFPGRQRLGQESELRIRVKNASNAALPNLAVTVEGFHQRVDDPTLADPRRNIWLINQIPFNSDSAFTDTWTLGSVPAGATRSAVWKVTAVRTGTYSLRYRVAAGTDGKAKAELPDGGPPRGSFIARISKTPRSTRVN